MKKVLSVLCSLCLLLSLFSGAIVPAAADEFVSENVFRTDLAEKTAIIKNISSGAVSTHNQFNNAGALDTINDGDTETKTDAYGANDWGNYAGVLFTLNNAVYGDHISIFAGYSNLTDTYDVYASDSLDTLYNSSNKVGSGIVCAGTEQQINVKKSVQYVAVFLVDYTSNGRIAEVELWSGDETQIDENAFVAQNVLRTDLAEKTAIIKNISSGAVSTHNQFNNAGALDTINDGNTATTTDAYGANDWGNHAGVLFTLNSAVYCGSASLYAGYSNLSDTYDVYASDSLENLYDASNKVGSGVVCTGAEQVVEVAKRVQYLAVFLTEYTYNGRIAEVELWTAEAPYIFEPVNVLRTSLDSVQTMVEYLEAGNITAESVNGVTAATINAYTDGNTADHVDLPDTFGWDPARKIGAEFALTEAAYIGEIKLYASIGSSYPESYSVYASDSLETLYSTDNKLADAEVTTGDAIVVAVNQSVQYVAFMCESCTGNPRFKEIEAWTAEEPGEPDPGSDPEPDPGTPFTSENVLLNHVTGSRCIQFYPSSHYVGDSSRISAENYAKFTDGDTSTKTDSYSALDWDPPRYIGIEYSLDDTYYIGNFKIYSGYTSSVDTFDIYASDSLDTLYNNDNLVASGVNCDDTGAQTVAVNKNVRYVTFLISGVTLYCARIAEFEAWTADSSAVPTPFASENVLASNVTDSRCIQFYPSSHYVGDSSRISAEDYTKFTDGDTSTKTDSYSALDWDPPRYIGIEYSLDDTYYIGNFKIYSGYTSSVDTFDIYASDSFDTLYNDANLVASGVNCDDTGAQTVAVNKNVRYVTFLISGVELYCARIAEFEAWTADPDASPEEPGEPEEPVIPEPINDGVTRVLTIGNSFAENASIYASEIAYANGQQMMFGYLKYPSCTLAQHLNAALNDTAMFKFRVTNPNGTGTTIADGSTSFYTIDQALAYTYWDVIVFQQESSNARNYATYAPLADLIDYVKDVYPNARLLFHQVWRWGEWNADQFDLIQAASENAAAAYGLPLIPSGLAFEYAREEIGSATAVNEDDGHYQHANTYGQFLAGCCYVATIFDIQIDPDTFAAHPYVNDPTDQYASTLVAAANRAVLHYGGDLDDDESLTATDLVMMRQALLGINDLGNAVLDVSRDGIVDIRDLVHMKKAIVATASAVADLYTLKTDGNRLLLNNTAVSLQGVNVPQLSWSSYGDGSTVKGQSNADTAMATALEWNSGIIRLAVNPDLYMNGGTGNGGGQTTVRSRVAYRTQIDGYIEAATAQGIPLVLDCHAYGGVTEEIAAFWETAAARYDKNDLVMFGLLNEPTFTWQRYFEGGYESSDAVTYIGLPSLITRIRALSDNVLVVGGIDYAGTLSEFLSGDYAQQFAQLASTGNGIVLDIHVYYDKYRTRIRNQIIAAAAQYPVLLGEYGPNQSSNGNDLSEEETAFLTNLFDLIDSYGLSSTAWSLGAHPYLTDTLGNVTAFGQSVRTFLASR